MHVVDLGIIIGYLLLTLVVGLYQGRKVKSMKDYAIADRNYATPIMVATVFATWVGGESTLGMAEKIFSVGLVFIFVFFGSSLNKLVIANIIAPRMKKFEGMISIGDMMESSYGKPGKMITGLAGTLLLIGTLGSQISALGYFISFFLDLSFMWSVLLGCGIVIIYSSFGGIKAVTITDVIQFGVLLVAIPMICNVSLNSVGGYGALLNALPDSHLRIIPEGESLWKYVGLILTFSLPFLNPAITQRLLMSKNTDQMAAAMRISAGIEIPFYLMVAVIGCVAVVSFPGINASHAIPTLITEMLPIGLKGLTIAGMMAVIMSTADSVLNAASITFVHDVLKPSLKGKMVQQSELKIAKIVSFIFGLLSLIMALSFESVVDIILNSFSVWGPVAVIPLYAVIFGVKADARTFIKSVLAGLSCFILWTLLELESLLGFDALVPSMLANGLTFFLCVLLKRGKNGSFFLPLNKKAFSCQQLFEKGRKVFQRSLLYYLKKWLNPDIGQRCVRALRERVEAVNPPYTAFGVFALINYIVPHFMWDISKPDDFILYFRSCAGVLAVILILKNYWPPKAEKYLPVIWLGTLLFCLPFLATYAALVNQGEIWWIMNLCLSIFILGTLVDWESFLWLLVLGSGAGYLFSMSQFPVVLTVSTEALYPSTYILLVSVVAGLLFSRRREYVQAERQRTLKAQAGAIAHEMRTPLATISFDGSFVSDVACALEKFGKTFTGKEKEAFDAEIKDLKGLSESLSRTSRESQNVVTLLLTNLQQDFTHLPSERLSMKEVLDHALESFVFKGDGRSKVHVTVEQDFTVKGNRDLLTHVFFNLLKNSLYFIQAAGKGEIFITLCEDPNSPNHHTVIFKDTGPGIKKEALPKLFTAFYSQRPHGTGIGLSFCQRVMESMKGRIRVDSTFGEHTTFTLTFPKEVG